MPLLMGFTPSSRIEEAREEISLVYDPMTQTVEMDMRVVGTKSLKVSQTLVRGTKTCRITVCDKMNEIDDKKYVQ